jgi:predicted transcriptional regulator of viral defense system
MNRQLNLLNRLVADGKDQFTFGEAVETFGGSASATGHTLARLGRSGLVDRVSRGRYAVRPVGALGTRAVSEDLATVIGAAFGGYRHRIAYRSALAEHDLLVHPVRAVYIACERQVRTHVIDGRPLRVVIERPDLIDLESEVVGRSLRSNVSRALLESAMRIELAGGITELAQALSSAVREVDPVAIAVLAEKFGPRGLAGERRLASLASNLNLPLEMRSTAAERPIIRLDPRDEESVWIDRAANVAWPISTDELLAVVEQ